MRDRLVALAAVLCLGAPAWAVRYGDIEVRPAGQPTGNTSHGYTEYRLQVRSHAPEGSGSHHIQLAVPGSGDDDVTRAGTVRAVVRRFTVEAGKTLTVSLLVPANPGAYGQGVTVWIDGRKQEDRVGMTIASSGYGRGSRSSHGVGGDLVLYYSQRVPEDFFTRVTAGAAVAGMAAGGGMGGGGPLPPPPAGGAPGGPPVLGGVIALPGPGGIDKEEMVPESIFQLQGTQLRADVPVSEWTRQWLGFTRFDGVVLTTEDIGELERAGNDGKAVLSALHQYVEAGGVLVVLGTRQPYLRAWKSQTLMRARAAAVVAPTLPPCGSGLPSAFVTAALAAADGPFAIALDRQAHSQQRITPVLQLLAGQAMLFAPGSAHAQAALAAAAIDLDPVTLGPRQVGGTLPAGWQLFGRQREGFTLHHGGFGEYIVSPDRDSALWSADRWLALQTWGQTGQPFNSTRQLSDLNASLAPVDDLSVPVGGLFALLLVFTCVIGPANIFLLAHFKRRIWMLWTVPLVSLLTCVGVFGYMVLSEGLQGHARVCGLTILDESERRATTLGRTTFYSPMTPSDGLRFSGETEVSALGTNNDPYGMHGYGRGRGVSALGSCVVDWTDGQHLARGWVSARVPAHFQLRKSESSRLRLSVQREGGMLVVTNMLGHDIKSLTLADEAGRLHGGGAIAAGAKTVLMPTGKWLTASNAENWRHQLFVGGDWATVVKGTPGKAESLLVPRSYLAVVDGSPFLEQALRGARERPTDSCVLGLMADLR